MENKSTDRSPEGMMPRAHLTRRDALKLATAATVSLPLVGTVPAWAADMAATAKTAPAPRRAARKLNLGLASFSLGKLTPAEVIVVVKQLELPSIALYKSHAPWDGTSEECRAAVQVFRDAGIAVTGTGVIDLPNDEATVRKAFENVHAAGLPLMLGRPAVEALPLVERYVRQHDIKVAIHNHGPGDLYPSPYDAWKVIQPYDARIGLCIDVGHAYRAGTDPAEAIQKCRERLYGVHLKDTAAPIGGPTKDPAPVVLGHGHMNIEAILAALLEVDFRDPVDFEYEQRISEKVPGLAECVGYARGMLATMTR
jgi:inosose dehydratase